MRSVLRCHAIRPFIVSGILAGAAIITAGCAVPGGNKFVPTASPENQSRALPANQSRALPANQSRALPANQSRALPADPQPNP